MSQRFHWLWTFVFVVLFGVALQAQTISTEILSVTSVCPGSLLDVNFTTDSQYNVGNTFTVELSKGGSYTSIVTDKATVVQTNRVSAIWHVTATIPTDAIAGNTYTVRVKATNPAVTGSPSSTTLTIKSKPALPTVDAVQVDCQRRNATDAYSTISLKIVSGAGARIYDQNSTLIPGNPLSSDPAKLNVYFQLPKNAAGTDNGFQYPISETTYYVSQVVDGCESDRAATVLRILYRPATGPKPVNQISSTNGILTYCQGDNALALNLNGHAAPPENFLTVYTLQDSNTSSTTTPPVPDTKSPGRQTYSLGLTPIDATKGCAIAPMTVTYLTVQVNARPTKPTVPASMSLCQFQSSSPLSASTTDGSASLVWYGRSATGGTGSTSAIKPSTDSVGTFSYYVAQKLNDCESERSIITVTVRASAPAPTVAAINYCQGIQAKPLSATAVSGGSLTWYTDASGGTGSLVAPTPATDNAGVQTFYVSQTVVNSCESKRTALVVTVTGLPAAPTIPQPAYTFCQNVTADKLGASGQHLRWYDAATGGTSVDSVKTPATATVGTKNYYVSQTINGCESSRSTVSVTIKVLPAAPGVTAKTICQFVNADPVSASGQNLAWYNADGNKFQSTPIPITDKGGSFTYLVTQSVDGCESPKAALVVTISTTPVPTVSKPIVEICVGGASQPLEAVGTNLKWTNPNGAVTTTAPTPPTLNATVKPEGDIYYVTQTGTNGCESPKVAIRVFVQTPPTMSISGTTTTNLGLEVPLNLTFTGVGPYRFKLSNGVSGTAISGTSIKDTTILVLPDRTTTYQVAEIANKCGVGLPGNGATATVTVMIPRIQTLGFSTTTLCAGTSLTTKFLTTGSFNPGSIFKLQFAKVETDSSKISYTDMIGSQVIDGQILGTIPASTAAGNYWVRVIATNPKIPILGNISPTLLSIRPLPTATLTGNQTIYEGQPASLTVVFTGDGPWSFSYRDSTTVAGTTKAISTSANPHVFEVRPAKTTTYSLTSVSNNCGIGAKAGGVVVVNLAILLAVDYQPLADAVDVYPVPVTNSLTVKIDGLTAAEPASLELTDLSGRTRMNRETRQATSVIPLDQYPAGTYILRIQVGSRTASKRIVKL